jgi:hypothetical protein
MTIRIRRASSSVAPLVSRGGLDACTTTIRLIGVAALLRCADLVLATHERLRPSENKGGYRHKREGNNELFTHERLLICTYWEENASLLT